MLPKFKMAARGHFYNILGVKKLQFYYHIPHDVDMGRLFLKVLLKFKMAVMDQLIYIFCGAKTIDIEVWTTNWRDIVVNLRRAFAARKRDN